MRSFAYQCRAPALVIVGFLASGAFAPASADEVFLDDVIIQGSSGGGGLCVGAGCTESEAFEFDTFRVKGDDPVINFQDTSSSGSFPTNDWLMGVRDGSSSTSVLFIKDVNGDDDVLQLESSTDGGVAIGFGATLETGAVSVGSALEPRRVVNVDEGTAPTDGVNLGQFQQFQSTSEANFAGEISTFDSTLDALESRMDAIDARLDSIVTRLDNL